MNLLSNVPDSNTLKQIVKEDEAQAKESGTPSSTQGDHPSPLQVWNISAIDGASFSVRYLLLSNIRRNNYYVNS